MHDVTAPRASTFRDAALTYGVAVAGGVGARLAHVPLPWMLGPLFAVAAVSLAGRRCVVVRGSRQVGQYVIGSALGLYFTPAVLIAVTATLPWMLTGCLAAVLSAIAGARLLSRRLGLPTSTAFFACLPAGAPEMVVLGEREGGDPALIAASHVMRVAAVVTVIPFALTWLGAHGAETFEATTLPFTAAGALALAGAAGAAGGGFHLLRVPNAWMLGPLALSAALTAAGMARSGVPGGLVNAAQVLIGCSLGAQFRREGFAGARAVLRALALATLQSGALMTAAALLLAAPAQQPFPTMVLAMAPGGIAEMCLTARVLRLGVPTVTAFHVLRLIVLIAVAPVAYRVWRRRSPRAAAPGPGATS